MARSSGSDWGPCSGCVRRCHRSAGTSAGENPTAVEVLVSAQTQAPKPVLTREPLAHLDEKGRPHLLADHLAAVARLARGFAADFGSGDWGYLAGLWHDLGKYASAFQRLIREENGFEAHIEGDLTSPRDHSSAGAIHACRKLGPLGLPLAFAIAGHHAGLPNLEDLKERLARREELYEAAIRNAVTEVLDPPPGLELPFPRGDQSPEARRRLELWIRMVFSALCDADFLDTERFYDTERAALRGHTRTVEELAARLADYLDSLEREAPPTELNRIRAQVRAASVSAATLPPGIFTLTVPTGGGKTLASMTFALEHAKRHGLKRVVVAIPFTSIIEQNAEVYREALGEDAVLEHHSALDPERETPRNRIACENWDHPVIVTTTVQLFESLFAHRPSACRKLHRLARSVIILDEAQTLPPALLESILDVLWALTRDYGTSIVISTATQPAFGRGQGLTCGFPEVREIVPDSLNAFGRLRRVDTRWPRNDAPTSWEDLAAEVAREPDVLVVVHRRADARELCERLDERLGHDETFHLSALMCPAHRSAVLAMIRERKARGEPVRLVSTQLVEAGVDLDFPVVYRALGGLDSLAQAAGRCNREGKLQGLGELRVFHAPTDPPPGVPRVAREATLALLRRDPHLDLFAPASSQEYFRLLYSTRDLDERGIQTLRASLRFREVATLFRIIEDDYSAPLVVPYGDFDRHLAAIEHAGPSRDRLRALQRYTVTVRRRDLDAWVARSIATLVHDTVTALRREFAPAYDRRFGLLPARVGMAEPGSLIYEE